MIIPVPLIGAGSVSDPPLIEVPAKQPANDILTVLLAGDSGWAELVQKVPFDFFYAHKAYIMNFIKKIIGRWLFVFSITAILAGSVWIAVHKNFPIIQDVLSDDVYGDVTVSRPLITYQALVVVFVDTKEFHADKLAYRIAQAGAAVAVIDAARAMHALESGENHCLNPERIGETLEILSKWADSSKNKRSILAGIGNGGLLPFLSAVTKSSVASRNLSVDFSVQLPDGTGLCSPLTSTLMDGHPVLTTSPPLNGKWLSVWTDHPENNTAVFVRGLLNAKTAIAPYDTPLDTVIINEIQKKITEENSAQTDSLPLVEVPANNPNETVTLFYSGDGGWRDLDRAVAGQMAKLGYPVVGVDMLRYFWSSKTPEKAADDLATIMAHYRTAWKAKNFVLAGYSFGADILPAVYNHLSEQDRRSVALLVLLALGKTADFEIHVSGWMGKNSSGIPILPELSRIQGNKILCIFGQEEKDDSACTALTAPGIRLMELPGGHHFDQDYPKLAKRFAEIYRQVGLTGSN